MGDVIKFVVGGGLVAAAFLVPGIGAVAGGALAAAMLTAGTGLIQAALTPAGAAGVEISLDNTVDTQNPLPVVYGGTVLPLRLIDLRVDPANNKDLWVVGAVCHGSENGQGIAGIDKIWLDGVLAVDDAGTVQTFYDGHLEFAKFTGTDTQVLASNTGFQQSNLASTLHAVFGTAWPTTSKGAGIACVVLKLTLDQNIYAGIPNVTVSVRGNKVYDPRTAFPRSNNSGWAYTPNPALCVADYLLSARYGMKFATSEVDCGTAGSDTTTSIRNMAAFCEQLVTKPDATTDWRFMCHGALDVSQAPTENLRRLLSSCRGAVFWEGGQARLAIRDVASPVSFTLDENVIVGDWSFRTPGAADAPNIIRATYPDQAQNYRADSVQWPNPGATNSYLTTDNGFESGVDIDLPMTVERWRAEQLALVQLKEQRSALPVQVTCTEAALQLRVGDVVPVTHSLPAWTAKPFWVTEIVFDPSVMRVRLSLVAYDANAYTLDAQTQYPDAPATGLPDPSTIAPPTGVTVLSDSTTASRLPDGSMVNRIKVSWTPPGDPFLNHYLLLAGKVGGTIATYGPALAGDTYFFLGPVPSDELWQVQMVAVNSLGRESAITTAVTVATAVLNAETPAVGNVLVNGDGQGSAAGADASGWTPVAGAHLQVATDKALYGDRSLKIDNGGTSQLSSSQQTVAVVAGDVWEIYGSVHVGGGLGGTGEGAGLQLSCENAGVYSALTVLDKTAPAYLDAGGASSRMVYTPRTDASNAWQFLRLVVRITTTGTLHAIPAIGYATGCSGAAWFDGLVLHKLNPALAIGGKRASDGMDDNGAVYVPDTQTVKVGTQSTPSSKSKQVTLTALDCEPTGQAATLGTFDNFGRFTHIMADSTSRTWQGRVFVPAGCTITNLASGLFRNNAGASAQAVLYRIDNGPARTALVTNTASGTGGWQAPGGSCSQLVSLGQWYLLEVTLNNGGTGSRSGFADQTVTYTMPDYASAY